MKKRAIAFCLAVLLCSICIPQSKQSTSLTSLVESERAFSKTSVEQGIRPSFMMFFADEAMVFRPHPVRYKEAMKSVPAPKNPLEVTLTWEPVWADVSQSGELGYTTGPSVWTDHSPARRPTYYGFYFSFWKKQPAGDWKVVFDVGTELPGPYEGSRTFRSPVPIMRTKTVKKVGAEEQRLSMMSAEQKLLEATQKNGFRKAFSEYVGKEARVYREKNQPIIGIDSINAFFSLNPYLSTWKPIECTVSEAGDLGYTYGSYIAKSAGERPQDEKGYYLHAWKRDASDAWKLVAEVISPLPPEVPKAK